MLSIVCKTVSVITFGDAPRTSKLYKNKIIKIETHITRGGP